jgi:hypothetical protein
MTARLDGLLHLFAIPVLARVLLIGGTIGLVACAQEEESKSTVSRAELSVESKAITAGGSGDELSDAYSELVESIERKRLKLLSAYEAAETDDGQSELIDLAALQIAHSISALVDYWYGTPWDFNGTTEVPGEGKIACGYFVTHVLRDAGFNLDTAGLAQQASEIMIRSLVSSDQIWRFSGVTIDEFVSSVQGLGPGGYLVGLDIHTGFILNTGRDVRFIHSSYIEPLCVVNEAATNSSILSSSRYRVLGFLSGDRELVLKWLKGEHFCVASR